ncbi:hypothetical protein, partial [Bradyrhizobium sp.]|uniref:hypothetical protein n=1 Tax=Bradyrhizobium sp. TaxID=376 RepID=UPI003C705A6A
KPLRRECRSVSAEPVCSCALLLLFLLHARPRVQRAPGIPCALDLEAQDYWQSSGDQRRETVKAYLMFEIRINERASTEVRGSRPI